MRRKGWGILGGWGWRHMQGDAGAGIITPDQESATRVGAAQGHSHQLGRGNCTTPLKLIFFHKNNWYGMVGSIWHG